MKDLIRKLNRARNMPPSILVETLTNIAKRKVRRYYIKIFPVKLSDRDFLKATGYKTIDDFLNRNPPLFFFNPSDKDKIIDTIKNEYPNSKISKVDSDGVQKSTISGLESMLP